MRHYSSVNSITFSIVTIIGFLERLVMAYLKFTTFQAMPISCICHEAVLYNNQQLVTFSVTDICFD